MRRIIARRRKRTRRKTEVEGAGGAREGEVREGGRREEVREGRARRCRRVREEGRARREEAAPAGEEEE